MTPKGRKKVFDIESADILGAAVARFRKKRRLTYRELAERFQCSASTLVKMEKEGIEALRKYADFLKKTIIHPKEDPLQVYTDRFGTVYARGKVSMRFYHVGRFDASVLEGIQTSVWKMKLETYAAATRWLRFLDEEDEEGKN